MADFIIFLRETNIFKTFISLKQTYLAGLCFSDMALSKRIIVLLLSSVLFLSSCMNKKAMEFKHALDVQERKVTQMLIGKKGSESRKLNYLIADDFDHALNVVNEQEREFDAVLHALKSLETADLEKASALQNAAINYYDSLKALHMYAKKEIAQQKVISTTNGAERDKAQDALMKLAKAKQTLYDNVYQTEEPFHNVLY